MVGLFDSKPVLTLTLTVSPTHGVKIVLYAGMEHLNCDLQSIRPISGETTECAFSACSLFATTLRLRMSVDIPESD